MKPSHLQAGDEFVLLLPQEVWRLSKGNSADWQKKD